MMKTAKRLVAIISLLAATSCFVYVMQHIFFNFSGEEPQRLKAFYLEDKHSIDVVVLGSSEVKLGYSAPEVYKQTGITSFPYCYSVNPVPLWKYELADIKRYQNPKVVIVEINGAIYEADKHIHSKGAYSKLAECMPFSLNKIKMAMNVRPEEEGILSSLIPFIVYHGKWDDIFNNSYYKDNIMQELRGYAVLRGAQTPLNQEKIPEEGPYPSRDETLELNRDGEKAFREFLDICKNDNDTKYIFVQFPHLMTEELSYNRCKRYNKAAEIIQEYGFKYIDYSRNKVEIGIDPKTDFYDSEHMNGGGQRKFSIFLMNQVKDEFNLEKTELSDKQMKEWSKSVDYIDRFYKYYDEYKSKHAGASDEADFSLKESYKVIKLLDEVK